MMLSCHLVSDDVIARLPSRVCLSACKYVSLLLQAGTCVALCLSCNRLVVTDGSSHVAKLVPVPGKVEGVGRSWREAW